MMKLAVLALSLALGAAEVATDKTELTAPWALEDSKQDRPFLAGLW